MADIEYQDIYYLEKYYIGKYFYSRYSKVYYYVDINNKKGCSLSYTTMEEDLFRIWSDSR